MTTTTTAPAFELSISPSSVRLLHRTTYHGAITVRDAGTQPLHVVVSAESLGCNQTPGEHQHWLTVEGAKSFTLQAGQSHVVSYRVSAAPGTTGSAAILATGTPAVVQAHPGRIAGTVGERVTLGTSTCHTAAAPAALPPVHNSGLPVADIGGGIAGLALAAAVIWAWALRRNRRNRAVI